MNIETDRLALHTITPLEARRILTMTPDRTDLWHPEYPLEDELAPLTTIAEREEYEDVFGLYMIRTRIDGLAIGGVGFFGPPDEKGVVSIGYGLVRAARGQGLAAEAVQALIELAGKHGAATVEADTTISNLASQNVLEKLGFRETKKNSESVWYERGL